MNEQELLAAIKKLGFEPKQKHYKDSVELEKENHSFRYWVFPGENYKLKTTPFFYSGKNDFTHFTSFGAFEAIMNSRKFRFYNLHNMDDHLELDHAFKELEYPPSQETNKENIYSFSFCKSTEDKTKKHLLWKLYGRDGKGVAFRFSFQNNIENWLNYHLVKISYDTKCVSFINELHRLSKREMLDTKICCFFKNPIYEFEDEVRLLFDNRPDIRITSTSKDGQLIYPKTFKDKLIQKENVSYFELPISNFGNENENYKAPNVEGRNDYEKPMIKIDQIILGYRYSKEDAENISKKLNRPVCLSSLKGYY